MGKVIVNGQEVEPAKKVNLVDSKSASEINKLLRDKLKELKK